MHDDPSFARIARESFAGHRVTIDPSVSWRFSTPGSCLYWFRITWVPGLLVVSGDVGVAAFRLWPSFETIRGAADIVRRSHIDYLAEKGGASRAYDPEGAVERIGVALRSELDRGERGMADRIGAVLRLADHASADYDYDEFMFHIGMDFLSEDEARRILGVPAEDLRAYSPDFVRCCEALRHWARHIENDLNACDDRRPYDSD